MMERYSNEVNNFLVNIVLPKIGLNKYSDDNIDEIIEYISKNYEDPLCLAEEAGDNLTDEDKELLRLATKAITEITTRSDWE